MPAKISALSYFNVVESRNPLLELGTLAIMEKNSLKKNP